MLASGRRKLGLVALVAAMTMTLAGCNWMQLGGNAGRTSFNDGEKDLTAAKLPHLDYQWIERFGAARAPVVYDNVVYVATGDTMRALNANARGTVWTKTITKSTGPVALHDPFIHAGRLGAFYTSGSVTGALDFDLKTGEVNDVQLHTSLKAIGTPALCGNVIVASVKYRTGTIDASMVSVNDGTDNLLAGLVSTDPAVTPTSPMLLGDRVFVAAGSQLFAFSLNECPPANPAGPCGPVWTQPTYSTATMPVAVGENGVAVGNDNGDVFVYDAATGNRRFSAGAGRGAVGGIAVARGVLYATTDEGELTAWNTNCANSYCPPLWTAETGPSKTAPVVAADVVYVGGGDAIRGFAAGGCGAATCSELWNAPVTNSTLADPGEIWPIVTGGRIYFAGSLGTVGMIKYFAPTP
jgi:outer membrane protein assembly factor BamB